MTDDQLFRRDMTLLELYRLFRSAWLREGDSMRKEDRQAEKEWMIKLSDVIERLEPRS